MKVWNVNDEKFLKYGKVIKGYDLNGIVSAPEKLPATDDVVYEPSEESLEKFSGMFAERFFGQMEVQVGFCNGKNYLLNAVEYHRSSEINIAAKDAILLLGSLQDVKEEDEGNFAYDTSLIEAFFVPANTAVELYATTLHYAPCSVGDSYFKMAVVLPRGTNYPLDKTFDMGEEKLLTARNKFLIAHKDAYIKDAFNGLIGDNIDVRND